MTGIERRRHQRVEMVTSVKVYDITLDKHSQGTIVNVSAGGLGILMEEKVDERSPVAVEFELPPRMVLRHLQAHVVRIHKVGQQYMVGIQFYRVPQQVEEDFARFVEVHGRDSASGVPHLNQGEEITK